MVIYIVDVGSAKTRLPSSSSSSSPSSLGKPSIKKKFNAMDIFRSFWGCLDVFRKSLPMYPLSVDDRKRAAENVDTFETFSHGRLPLSSQSSRQAAVTGATWTRAILAHTPTGDFF